MTDPGGGRRPVQTDSAPAAIGAYSQAIIAGDLVHCSGQVALDPVSAEMVGETAVEQAEQVLANLRAVLEAAGASMGQVLKCNVYLTNLDDFAAVNEVYARAFEGGVPPARACVEVSRLPKGALVEMDCVATLEP
ncbi:MAG TPA: RidA family protein [Planctomycetes bacterium]|nr:RidA family protein [Planctomycetota bacterium]HIK62271.1 RidA family protein [Planctomycetota bacterium]